MLNETNPISYMKIFDNFTQVSINNCQITNCPGMLLRTPTPSNCVCICSDGYILNGSGTNCTKQITFNVNELICAAGKFNHLIIFY